MNSDIEKWVEYLKQSSRKRKHPDDYEINSDEMINELRLMAICSLEDIIAGHNFRGRKLTNFLNTLENTLKQTKLAFNDDQVDMEFSLMISAFTSVMIDLVNNIKIEIYSHGNKFSLDKYFNFLKNQTPSNKKRKTEITKIDIALDMPIENDVEDDTEHETTDEEYVEESDEEESDEEESDEESGEEASSIEEEYELVDKSSNRKINRIFMDELNKTEKNGDTKDEIMRYFCSLDNDYKRTLIDNFKQINNCLDNDVPALFKILNMPIPDNTKKSLLNKLIRINTSFGETGKLKAWLDNVMKIPFGIYKGININSIKPKKVKKFLKALKTQMDDAVWGHDEAKRQIVQTMGQHIRNPQCKGNVLGIWGPPGNGKTSLIKDGIAKAMNKAFIFISLGGATDASVLEGHSYTYEGSIYGRIAQGIIKSKCMDPIIYFDELDKVSSSSRGMEIINCLVHLVDPAQNNEFVDKYFYNLKLDLSKVTFMFSYNNPSMIDPILKDRITQIQTKYLLLEQKIHIAQNYLLPNILKDVGIKEPIEIKDKILEQLISKYTNEGGVRKIKKMLYSIVRQINILNLTNERLGGSEIIYPFKLKKEHLPELLQEFTKIDFQKIQKESKVGVINGLWAGSLGIGGVLPIESKWIPSKDRNFIEATGSLEKVIKESVKVASTLAWNLLDDKIKQELNTRFEKDPYGIHIHCPDGATPKDGPSAGTALTVLLLSLYTNKKIKKDLAITGEINLQGQVLQIGGLEEKLTGAKKAGIKTALIPISNLKDIVKIKLRNSKLISDDFEVIPVENINQVVEMVFE